MFKKLIGGLLAASMILGVNASAFASDSGMGTKAASAKKMEYLTRGAFGASIDGNIYLSWRLLGTEPMDTTFNIYCNGQLLQENVNNTNWTHVGGSSLNKYQIAAVVNGKEAARSKEIEILQGYKDSAYKNSPYAFFDVPITPPSPKFCTSYSANDASVGDVDGDGEYEIILKWDPDNSKDSAAGGITGNVYIDAYEMDGTRLWRIDLGRNIRAGAHYTQYIVYDLDGDGRAEVAMKTAPGSVDGQGNFVSKAGKNLKDPIDDTKEYIGSNGHITGGPEYLTVFDGQTGAALRTIDYKPGLGDVNSWGDGKYNRSDRYLAGVGYFDGVHPSLFMCRGYYRRSAVTAYDWDGENLTERWAYDTGTNSKDGFYGQGNHQISVADLDNDGFDEIVYGSAALDHDGKLLHSMGWGHGDALHVSDFDNDGRQEIFSVLEDNTTYGTGFRRGDGSVIWKIAKSDEQKETDIGRGIMANVSAKHGAIGWSTQVITKDGKNYSAWDTKGKEVNVTSDSNGTVQNFAIWWDGDLLRELLDRGRIIKYDDASEGFYRFWNVSGPIANNNSTKYNPCLQADLFGDWREEIIYRHADNSALRIFTSLIPTDYKLTTLMHDSQYRCAVAWQNVGYNQPPHQSYYIGPEKTAYTQPNVEPVIKNLTVFTVKSSDGSTVEAAKIEIDENIVVYTDSDGKAEVPVLPGKHSYTVKCVGFENVHATEFTVDPNDAETNVEKVLDIKSTCDILVSYTTNDGKVLKPSESLEPTAISTEYVLDEKYKDDITAGDGTVYEYNPNLSGDTVFTLTDDVEIKLVFSEKTLPGPTGTEIYRTNFSKNGFAAGSEKHGYTAGTANYGVDPSGIKYGMYSIGDESVSIKIPNGLSKFVAEFDMAYNADSGSGGAAFGITPFNKNGQGPTIGMRLNGSLVPQFGYFAGGSNYNAGGTVVSGKVYRYVVQSDGEKLYMTVGDPATGAVVWENIKDGNIADVPLRNLKDISANNITELRISKGNGTGNANIALGDVRIYQIGGANSFEWPQNSEVFADMPSKISFAPLSSGFKTGINDYVIPTADQFSYELQNIDGTAVSSDKGVSLNENGELTVSENAPKGVYKVICKCNGIKVKEFKVNAVRNRDVVLYQPSDDPNGEFFKYSGGEGGELKYSNSQWEFVQNSTGGRDFAGDFYASDSGEATLKFSFRTGWQGSALTPFNAEIQLLDASYEGENPEDHIALAFSQDCAAKVQEVQYYTKHAEKQNIKNDSKLFGTLADSSGITARTVTTWDITVKFNFDNDTVSFDFCQAGGEAGYRYENIPTGGGFKTIRIVSNGNESINWKPRISNLSYSKSAFEPSPVDANTISVEGGNEVVSVNFEEPDDGGAPVTYHVVLIDADSGEAAYEKDFNTVPAVFENAELGQHKYNVKITASNAINTSDESAAGPFDVEVVKENKDIPIENVAVTVEKQNVSVSFDKPEGFESVTYTISLINSESGETVYEKQAADVPVVFENVAFGKYNVKITASDTSGANGEASGEPIEIKKPEEEVKPSVAITVSEDAVANGKLSFKANVATTNISDKKGVVFAAIYDSNGALIDSSSMEKAFVNGDNIIDFNLDMKGKSNAVLRIFVWDAKENMKPINNTAAFEKSY